MALINCPECGKEISDKAKNCIHCGFPLDSVGCDDKPETTENVNIAEAEPTSVYSENILPKAESTENKFNFKEFIINYKKIIISCFIGVLAIIVLCVLFDKPSFDFDKPSFEENLSGTWTSSRNSSSGKATVTFLYEDDILTGELSYYDYEGSEWDKMSFKVDEYTDYTMTLLFDGGKIDKFSYSMGGDKLIFDGVIYTNEDKNIKVDETKTTYMLDGVPMPIRKNIYFGMSKSEIKEFADSDFIHISDDGDTYFYELPDFFYPQVEGYTTYDFDDDGGMNSLDYAFYDSGSYSEMNKLKNNIIDAYDDLYGEHFTYEWNSDSSKGSVSYIWTSGNMSVEFVVWDDGDFGIWYSLEDKSWKKSQ